MRSFRSDPYLWVHLAGVAAVPIFLELCLLGLGMGKTLMPIWFELLFVGGVGIAPILWMQWQKPFSIFSVLLLAVRSDHLSEDQRKILGLFKDPVQQVLSVLVAVGMGAILWQLYRVAPIAHGLILPGATRGLGLLWAAIAFFFANLFLQVPMSVLRVLLLGKRTFMAIVPYPVEKIPSGFTVMGLRVNQILPPLIPQAPKPVIDRSVEPIKEKVVAFEETREITEAVGVIAETNEAVAEKSEAIVEKSEDNLISSEDNLVLASEPTEEDGENTELTVENLVSNEVVPVSNEDDLVSNEVVPVSSKDDLVSNEDDLVSNEDHVVSNEDEPALTEVGAIEQPEPETVVEIEVIKLEETHLPPDGDPDAEDFGAEDEGAIVAEVVEEDWGDDDDLDDL
jgi:hypothetical protein